MVSRVPVQMEVCIAVAKPTSTTPRPKIRIVFFVLFFFFFFRGFDKRRVNLEYPLLQIPTLIGYFWETDRVSMVNTDPFFSKGSTIIP